MLWLIVVWFALYIFLNLIEKGGFRVGLSGCLVIFGYILLFLVVGYVAKGVVGFFAGFGVAGLIILGLIVLSLLG